MLRNFNFTCAYQLGSIIIKKVIKGIRSQGDRILSDNFFYYCTQRPEIWYAFVKLKFLNILFLVNFLFLAQKQAYGRKTSRIRPTGSQIHSVTAGPTQLCLGSNQRGRVALLCNKTFFSNFELVFQKTEVKLKKKNFLNFGHFSTILHRFTKNLAIKVKMSFCYAIAWLFHFKMSPNTAMQAQRLATEWFYFQSRTVKF